MYPFILIGVFVWIIMDTASKHSATRRDRKRKAEIARLMAEQERQREAVREAEEKAKETVRQMVEVRREQMRQAEEQARLKREQERQAETLARHEVQLMKIEARLASAESEIAFNREQRDRLFELLDIEELERDSAIKGSKTWQAHHRKVISLESQIHAVQKRIDKAQMDKAICEKQMSA